MLKFVTEKTKRKKKRKQRKKNKCRLRSHSIPLILPYKMVMMPRDRVCMSSLRKN
jgi:hypothetical protein